MVVKSITYSDIKDYSFEETTKLIETLDNLHTDVVVDFLSKIVDSIGLVDIKVEDSNNLKRIFLHFSNIKEDIIKHNVK